MSTIELDVPKNRITRAARELLEMAEQGKLESLVLVAERSDDTMADVIVISSGGSMFKLVGALKWITDRVADEINRPKMTVK